MRYQADPGRLILASSTAVYGSRNGAKDLGLATDSTPVNPRDVYGAHKVAAESIVRASGVHWSILRIGGIIASDLARRTDADSILMDAIIPSDNRIHSVDVVEVAEAFANAVDADCLGLTLLIAGDETHMLRQSEFATRMMTIAGLGDRPSTRGRRGDPDDDTAWFLTDWMDTRHGRQVLGHRAVGMGETIATCRAELSPRLRCPATARAEVALPCDGGAMGRSVGCDRVPVRIGCARIRPRRAVIAHRVHHLASPLPDSVGVVR
jgi:nucleoside-diphosphate-sugar epimerase